MPPLIQEVLLTFVGVDFNNMFSFQNSSSTRSKIPSLPFRSFNFVGQLMMKCVLFGFVLGYEFVPVNNGIRHCEDVPNSILLFSITIFNVIFLSDT